MKHLGKLVVLLIIAVLVAAIFVSSGTVKASSETPTGQEAPITWSKAFCGPQIGQAFVESIVETADGGYVVAVQSYALGPRVGCLLVKLDSQGNVEWSKAFTADYDIVPLAMVQTTDGGFAITGFTTYYPQDNHTRLAWFAKTDSQGNTEWIKTYGDKSIIYEPRALTCANDGGYTLAGDIGGANADTSGWGALLIKIDSAGDEQWIKIFDVLNDDRCYAIVQTTDDGYAIAGTTSSTGNIPHFWLVKTDSAGNKLWDKTYQHRDTSWDIACSVIQTSDGGYALSGETTIHPNNGNDGCFWLVKTDASGRRLWDKEYGLLSWGARCVIETSEGGYALSGYSSSESGNFDLIKINSSGETQWTYPGEGNAHVVIQTSDGGYALAGSAGENFWVAKIDSNGNGPTSTTVTSISLSEAQSPSPTPTNPPPSTTEPENMPVLSLSCKSQTSPAIKVTLNGQLSYNGAALADLPILLSYSVNNGASWVDLTTVNTDKTGSFSALWTPLVTGSFLIKAVWNGSSDYPTTNTTVSLTISPYQESLFSVSSNSTLTSFSFDSQQKKITFQVSGPQDTNGYVDLYIPKTLLSDVSSLTVNLDETPVTYQTESDGNNWLISFSYHHSSHQITVDLNAKTGTTLDLVSQWVARIAIGGGIAAIIVTALLVIVITRKKFKVQPK
jgi:hypothetical protein